MRAKTKIILILFCLSLHQLSVGQTTNFEKGYQDGLKNGYCYNVKGVFCTYPITFLFPMPRLNESSENYQDGYNRGFQIGLDFQRIDNDNPNIDYYDRLSQRLPNYISNKYVEPVDLNLLATVNLRKQKLFYSRAEWIQQQIYRLGDLSTTLLSDLASSQNQSIQNSINDYAKVLSSGVDYSDYSIFNQITDVFNNIENRIRNAYRNTISNVGSTIIPNLYFAKPSSSNCYFSSNSNTINNYKVIVNNVAVKPLNYTTFNLTIQENSNDLILYYIYSKLDNCYYYTSPKKFTNSNSFIEMSFTVKSKAMFMRANEKSFWIFYEGTSRSDLDDLGEKVYKTANGIFEVYKVYKDKSLNQTYYIPKETYYYGDIHQEYAIYSN